MRKAILVALREYTENVKRKGFWIGIMILPVIYALMILLPAFLERNKPIQRYAVLDESRWLADLVISRARILDLALVFGRVAERYREEGPGKGIPEPFQPLAPILAGLDEGAFMAGGARDPFPPARGHNRMVEQAQ